MENKKNGNEKLDSNKSTKKRTQVSNVKNTISQQSKRLESKMDNSIEVLSKTTDNIFKNYIKGERSVCDIVLANLIALFAIFISTFLPVVNITLPILLFIYFGVGVFGFVYNCESEKKYKFEDIFISIKKFVKTFCLFVVKMILIFFWGCLFIVPGVVCMLNYSFTSLIIFENHDIDVKGVMLLSKELVRGHRWTIFFYMLFALASICVAMTLMFLIIMLFDLFLAVPNIYYIVFVLLAGLFDFFLMAVPLVEIAVADAYIVAKKEKTSKDKI